MKKIDVFQCELNKTIQLEYIGSVRYIDESFGVDSLTNGSEYNIVKDDNGDLKVVDGSEEDYLYDLINPRPLDNSSPGGRFYYVDDPQVILKKVGIEKYEAQ